MSKKTITLFRSELPGTKEGILATIVISEKLKIMLSKKFKII